MAPFSTSLALEMIVCGWVLGADDLYMTSCFREQKLFRWRV